jgi:pyruvate/2-oxoglutarate/acetoin dehydrogenase E1 component
MAKYFDELKRSMEWLGRKKNTFFMGQAVIADGTAMSNTLKQVAVEKRLELPVFENTQLGMSLGMALNGSVPVSIFPRWNFLACASDQLVNHVDKVLLMSDGGFRPKLIIRTSIGSERPLHPQHQHVGDFTDAYASICKNIEFIRLEEPEQIFSSYVKAYERTDGKSTVLIEWGDFYNEK